MKRFFCLMMTVTVIVLCFAGCQSTTVDFKKFNTESALLGNSQNINNLSQKTLVAENTNFKMFYDNGIYVESKADSSDLWKSYVDETVYDGFKTSTETWKNYMQSIAAVTYISKTDTAGNFSTDYSASKNNIITVQKYDNGCKITVKFVKSSITMCFEITLDDFGLSVRIPADSIKEEGDYYLYSVELFPFFDAASNEKQGYIFYPDGCGALTYFNKTAQKHKYTKQLVLDVYGTEETANHFSDSKNPIAPLPIYGIKNQNRAFLAAVTNGDADTQININAGINISSVKLNRASFSLIWRRKYTVLLSELKNNSGNTEEKSSTRVGERLLDYDREVKLFFLSGENASYSGMANTLRDYLLENGILDGKTDYKAENLCLRFFMGTKQTDGAYKKLVKTADFGQIEDMLGGYKADGVSNITAILRGWQSGGYGDNISSFAPEGSFGGKKGLKSLDRFAGENGIKLMLETDNINAYDGSGIFIKGKDTVTDGAGSPVTDSTESSFLLNLNKIKQNFIKASNTAEKYKNTTILNNGLASLIYSDLNRSVATERVSLKAEFEEMLKKGGAVSGGNLYSLKYSDFIADCAGTTSNSFLEDVSVPFYQMVVHGSAAYCMETGNSSYDLNYQKLKWIEYGALPYFEITKENPSLLRDTGYTQLFSSENGEWQERITEIYKEFKNNLSEFANGYITQHEIIADDIVCITYNDKTEVYLNYSDEKFSIDGAEIPPLSYKVITRE